MCKGVWVSLEKPNFSLFFLFEFRLYFRIIQLFIYISEIYLLSEKKYFGRYHVLIMCDAKSFNFVLLLMPLMILKWASIYGEVYCMDFVHCGMILYFNISMTFALYFGIWIDII